MYTYSCYLLSSHTRDQRVTEGSAGNGPERRVQIRSKVLRVMLLSNNVLYKVWNQEKVARRFVGSLPRIPPIACEAPAVGDDQLLVVRDFPNVKQSSCQTGLKGFDYKQRSQGLKTIVVLSP